MGIRSFLRQTAKLFRAQVTIDKHGEAQAVWQEVLELPCLLDRISGEARRQDAGISHNPAARAFFEARSDIKTCSNNALADRLHIDDELWEVLAVRTEHGPALSLKIVELQKTS